MIFNCPLCGKPVTKSLYDKITGIWQERAKQLNRIKEERLRLREEIRGQKRKLQEQAGRFGREKNRLIRVAVDKRTKTLNHQLASARLKERELEKRTAKRIAKMTTLAHAQAGRAMAAKLKQLKKEMKESSKVVAKRERERAKSEVEQRYRKLRYTFDSTLRQMATKSRTIREQQGEIAELQRQLKRQTTPSVEGLLYEATLLQQLRKKFPDDRYLHTGKGGDILHSIVQNGKEVGRIVYECKRVKNYSVSHVVQTWEAKEKRKADFGILVTNAMKRGTQGFFAEKGVMIVHPAGVLSLVAVLRGQVVQIADMKLGQLQKDEAIRLTVEYLEGPEFSNSMEGIVEESISLYDDLKEEMKRHFLTWKKRYQSYAKIHSEASRVKDTTNAAMKGQVEREKVLDPLRYPELIQLPVVE